MKGASLVADIFLLLMSIVTILIITGLVFVFREIYGIESVFGIGPLKAGPREVTLRVLLKPATDESNFLSFLELEYQSFPMKKIIGAVAIQNNTSVWIENKKIDATQATKELFESPNKGVFFGRKYLLKIRDPEIIIARSLNPLASTSQKILTKIYLLEKDKYVDLELYID